MFLFLVIIVGIPLVILSLVFWGKVYGVTTPAATLNLYQQQRQYKSGTQNPFDYGSILPWASGNYGTATASEIGSFPEYKPCIIGTITFHKGEYGYPAKSVCCIIDNVKAGEIGLAPCGIPYLAQQLAEKERGRALARELYYKSRGVDIEHRDREIRSKVPPEW